MAPGTLLESLFPETRPWRPLTFAPGSREAWQWGELDRRLAAFLASLPPEVRAAGLRQSTYSGQDGDHPFGGIGPLNPVLVGTPWHFRDFFASVPEREFIGLAEAGALHVLASVVADHLADDQIEPRGSALRLHQALSRAAQERFRDIMGSQVDFWAAFQRSSARHAEALAVEMQLQRSGKPIPLSSLEAMAAGKVAPIVVTVASLAYRARREAILPSLEGSLAKIAVASQMLDDVLDWRLDLARHHRTHFLSRLVSPSRDSAVSWPTAEWVEGKMLAGWQDVEALEQVGQWMDESLSGLGDLECPAWRDYVDGYRRLTASHLNYAVATHLRSAVGALLGESRTPTRRAG